MRRVVSYELRTGAGAESLPFVSRPRSSSSTKKKARRRAPAKPERGRARLDDGPREARAALFGSPDLVVESRHGRVGIHAITYQRELVKCGKCAKCGKQAGHGPYWYAYWKAEGRVRKRYIGADFHELRARELDAKPAKKKTRRAGYLIPAPRTPAPLAPLAPALGNRARRARRRGLPKTASARLEPVAGPFYGRNVRRGVGIYRRPGAKPDELVDGVRVHEVQGKKALVSFGTTKQTKWVRVEQIAMI